MLRNCLNGRNQLRYNYITILILYSCNFIFFWCHCDTEYVVYKTTMNTLLGLKGVYCNIYVVMFFEYGFYCV